ncbi:hypothetical protein H310_05222 [Aphanomyces invadans]|uniref:Uncharacterized protein n=1 Tax=Aphanomyces invadans TaxID=157072 RepID=A0A024UE36_9STRA|nr:hypothetical protein H310_05222 [Aphanomyces invadans]ETW03878.1 hypothetical protein H310_05222 [Aphanomyces invadans]|eukprot:XP_008868107.1 hypothetical protein H310_05222 [Aphanomyces invadans]
MPRDALVEVSTREDCTVNMAVRTTTKGAAESMEETSTDDTQHLALPCHSLPSLVYYVSQPILQSNRDAAPVAATSHRHHADSVTNDSDDGGGGDGNDDMGAVKS